MKFENSFLNFHSTLAKDFFELIHVNKELLEIINDFSKTLQLNSQDILNAIRLVSLTKKRLQQLREDGGKPLLESLKKFCEKYEIEILNARTKYK
ncbi:Uncharacterized protein TCM_010628 [Theobroma cacao]|uniref:Uncharacterized protein n=1 Tax=Theobroma cacao TaxID=3641 RepID=A0A061E7W7_THECC|nr:Uncharacterized protein TCM_010628 [Theobroma cacao]